MSTTQVIIDGAASLATAAGVAVPGTPGIVVKAIASALEIVGQLIPLIEEKDRQIVTDLLAKTHAAAIDSTASNESGALSDLAAAAAEIDVIDANNKAGHVL